MANQDTVELRWIFVVIMRHFWIIILLPILAILATVAVTSLKKPVYESSVVLYVQPNSDSSTNDYNLILAGQQLAGTYSEMLQGPSVLQMVINKLSLHETPVSLAKRVAVSQIKNTQLINITVTDPSPNQAALLANTIANTFIAQVQTLPQEQFKESIKNVQSQMDIVRTTITGIQAKIDSSNAKGVDLDVELNRQQLLLNDLLSDNRALEQKQQALELALTQLPDSVKIVAGADLSSSPVTQANVSVMVGQPPAALGTDFAPSLSSDQMALTFVQIVTASPVLDATIKELNLPMSAEQLASFTKVKPVSGTQLINITVTSPFPTLNSAIANSLSKNFITQAQGMISGPYNTRLVSIQAQEKTLSASIDQAQTQITSITSAKVQGETDLSRLNDDLSNQLSTSHSLQSNYDQLVASESSSTDTIVVSEKATPSKSPIDNRLIYALIAALIGVLLGVALSFLLEQLDDQIRTEQDLSSILGLTNLGTIRSLNGEKPELVMDSSLASTTADDFRVLGTNIRFSLLKKPLYKLLVTSPKSEGCKSIVSANVAAALAQTGLKVSILDADLRVPRLQTIFKYDRKVGSSEDLLEGNNDIALQPTKMAGLSILYNRHGPSDSGGILTSTQLTKMFHDIAKKADIVIIDSPAILDVADTTLLSSLVDGVVVVIPSGHTSNQDGKEAIARLRQANAQLIGGVLYTESGHNGQLSNYSWKGRSRNLLLWIKQDCMSIVQFFDRISKQGRESPSIQPSRGK